VAHGEEQQSIRVDAIGSEREPVVVVENFSPHPDRLIPDFTRYAPLRRPVPRRDVSGQCPHRQAHGRQLPVETMR
jgi:hypothetical protein